MKKRSMALVVLSFISMQSINTMDYLRNTYGKVKKTMLGASQAVALKVQEVKLFGVNLERRIACLGSSEGCSFHDRQRLARSIQELKRDLAALGPVAKAVYQTEQGRAQDVSREAQIKFAHLVGTLEKEVNNIEGVANKWIDDRLDAEQKKAFISGLKKIGVGVLAVALTAAAAGVAGAAWNSTRQQNVPGSISEEQLATIKHDYPYIGDVDQAFIEAVMTQNMTYLKALIMTGAVSWEAKQAAKNLIRQVPRYPNAEQILAIIDNIQ